VPKSVIKAKKDATPIKEEDIEDDTSAYDDDRRKTLKKVDETLFDRDEREDEQLQDDLKLIERESKISRS
jgi:hypothetical protein